MEDSSVKNFCCSYSVTSIINSPTCFENPEKTSCIDLILANCPRSFQNSCAIKTGLSDFPKLLVPFMNTTYKKSQPKIVIDRCYKYFKYESFREELKLKPMEITAVKIWKTLLLHAMLSWINTLPSKKKHVRGD